MSDSHTEMHQIFGRINSIWAGTSRAITDADWQDGRVAEVIRWRRNKLGGQDKDLCGPPRWEAARRGGWSIEATYSFLGIKANTSWATYVHDTTHNVYAMLGDDSRGFGAHGLELAKLELELVDLVSGWLKDEARGISHTFEQIKLSRPGE